EVAMKIVHSLGMKYTKSGFAPAALNVAATLASAQAHYPRVTASSSSLYSDVGGSTSVPIDDQNSVLTIKKRVDEVNVLFIATDRHGKFVRNLNERDFHILDDHKPPQPILAFKGQTDLPLEMGLLVDVSGSVHSRFDFEQEA